MPVWHNLSAEKLLAMGGSEKMEEAAMNLVAGGEWDAVVPFEETDEAKKFSAFVKFTSKYFKGCERLKKGKWEEVEAKKVELWGKKVDSIIERAARGGNSYVDKVYRIGGHGDGVDGDGCGVFATRALRKGDLVIKDKSVLKHPGSEWFTEEASEKWFLSLSDMDQERVVELKAYTTEENKNQTWSGVDALNTSTNTDTTWAESPKTSEADADETEEKARCKIAHNVVRTNSFREEGFRVLYPILSRINHSCAPNVWQQNGSVYATRDIEWGEEICWCYPQGVILTQDVSIAQMVQNAPPLASSIHSHFLFLDFQARKKHLKRNYEFTCWCSRCKEETAKYKTTGPLDLLKEHYEDALTECVTKRFNKIEEYHQPDEKLQSKVNLEKPEYESEKAKEERKTAQKGRGLDEQFREKLQSKLREFMTFYDILNMFGALHEQDWHALIKVCEDLERLMKQVNLECRRVQTTIAMVRSLYESCRLPALVNLGEEVIANKHQIPQGQLEEIESEMVGDLDNVVKRTEEALKLIVAVFGANSSEVAIYKTKLTQLLHARGLLEYVTYSD